jgi:hypothetical protein
VKNRRKTNSTTAAAAAAAAAAAKGFEAQHVDEFGIVPESQASRAAGEMLRSFGSVASSASSPSRKQVPGTGVIKQSRIIGQLTKSGVSPVKDKLASVEAEYQQYQSSQGASPEKRRNVSGLPGPEVERAALGSSGSPKKRKVDGGAGERLDPLGISY